MATTTTTKGAKKGTADWFQQNSADIMAALDKNMNPSKYIKLKPMFELIDKYNAAVAKTNEANEQRYQQGLGLLNEMETNLSGYNPKAQKLDEQEYGKAERAGIKQAQREGTAADMQSLVSSGLFNTTIANSARANRADIATRQNMELDENIAKYRQERLDRQYDQNTAIAQNKLNMKSELTGQRMNWIYNKQDVGPDPAVFSQMMAMYAKKPSWFKGLSSSQANWWKSQIGK